MKMGQDGVKSGNFGWQNAQGKHFVVRPSALTQLLENPEARNLFHMVLVGFAHFVALEAALDLVETGSIDLGWANFAGVFGSPLLTLSMVLVIHLLPILLFYPLFRLWVILRFNCPATLRQILDFSYYFTVILIFGSAFYLVFKLRFDYNIPLGSTTIIGAEGTRILMKVYAFVRTNTPRVHHWTQIQGSDDYNHGFDRKVIRVNGHPEKNMGKINSLVIAIKYENELSEKKVPSNERENEKNTQSIILNSTILPMLPKIMDKVKVKNPANDEDEFKYFDDTPCPTFTNLLYFLYAPTLVYRDNYPRTPNRSWSFIFWQTLHFCEAIFLYFLLHRRFGYIMLENFGAANPLTQVELVKIMMGQFTVGLFGYVMSNVIVLHLFQNIFAELLRFGDRQFYADWWSATCYSEYHRKWNYVVCDWLYVYVYRDVRKLKIAKRFRSIPAMVTLVISALFHELGACFILRFFCPAVIILFGGPGIVLTFVSNKNFPRLGNLFLHWGLGLGCAFMHLLYSMEHFARVNNCPSAQTPLLDFFVPRFPYCNAFQWDLRNLTAN